MEFRRVLFRSDIGEHGRFDEPAAVMSLGTAPAGNEPRFVAAFRDIGFDAVAMRSRGHRPDMRGGVERIADREARHRLRHRTDDLVVARIWHEKPRSVVTGLPVIEHAYHRNGRRSGAGVSTTSAGSTVMPAMPPPMTRMSATSIMRLLPRHGHDLHAGRHLEEVRRLRPALEVA